MDYDPISVALKFGFLAVLYLFLLWIARSALKDLRGTVAPAPDATGFHPVPSFEAAATAAEAWLVALRGGALREGERFDLIGGLSIGRSGEADLRIEDRYASGLHARIFSREGRFYVEDMSSTNGTLLNDVQLHGEAELIDRDVVRIGDTEFRFEAELAMLRIDDQAYRTDTGRQRSENEDSLFVRAPIFVVADGMGGAQAGEVASKTAVDAFDRDLPEGPPERFLRETIEAANRRIHELARDDPSRAGMGTTITAAVLDAGGEEVSIGHVGDSRAYRLRRGRLERLTRDHSLVEEMRRKGQITDAQAEDHPQRSIITRALGPEPEVEVDLQTTPAAPGDVFLLCSDGLTTMVSEDRIAAALGEATSMSEAVRTLIDEANGAGGRDNITALVFRLADAAAPRGESPEDATLIGAAAEEAGLTATEVRRRAAAAAAAERRQRLGAESKPGRLGTAAKALALVALLALLAFGAWYGNRQVWFLGTDDAGRVSLYRGLPYELPLGISLYEELYASPIQTEALPNRRREAVSGHDLRSRDDAVSLIEDIERSQGVP